MCYDFNMKEEIINISKTIGIDDIGFCNIHNLVVPYDKYKLQEEKCYKSTFQVGDITDKDLSQDKYKIYNTAIVILVSYDKVDMSDKSKVYLSSCSIGEDYHILLKDKLNKISEYLDKHNYISKIYVDNNPLDERNIAYNAGLGFFGINNLLINERLGSYFYIGVLLTDALIESDSIKDNKCINCGLCIDICPNKAINDSGILNSNKCISYLNQKKNITENESVNFDNCIYGCDKCISVCPYNKNVNVINDSGIEIDEFLNMNESEYKNKYSNSSCYWRGKKVLDRNVNIYVNYLKNK